MRFTPKSEKEVSKMLEKGTYKFVINKAKEEQSKNGNPMMHLELSVDDKGVLVHDYLLTENPAFEFKLRHACYSVGLGIQYESGEITESMLEGKKGFCMINIQKDKTGQYPDKNIISDYVTGESAAADAVASGAQTTKAASLDDSLDEIPF